MFSALPAGEVRGQAEEEEEGDPGRLQGGVPEDPGGVLHGGGHGGGPWPPARHRAGRDPPRGSGPSLVAAPFVRCQYWKRIMVHPVSL